MTLFRSLRPGALILALLAPAACGGPGGQPVDVTAREYVFQGVPETLQAGEFEFSITNEGSEVHELHIFRLSDEVENITSLIGMSQDESAELLETVEMATANPGDTESFGAELAAGRYAALCLIPVGTGPAGEHEGHDAEEMEDMVFDPNADTHFRRGMWAGFEVS